MKIEVNCKAVAVTKTKKGSYKIVFVSDDAAIFTCYKKEVTTDDLEELEIMAVRTFDIKTDDVLFFIVEPAPPEKGD